jgi:hypothetical protein
MLVQLAEGIRWPSCSTTGATVPRPWSGLGGRSTSPGSRASARARRRDSRCHDQARLAASRLRRLQGARHLARAGERTARHEQRRLRLNIDAWALLLGAAGVVMLRTGADARTATSRSPPPVGAREHPELHLRRPAHVHAHVCLDHRHQRVATPPWRAHRGRRRSRRAGHRLTPLARCAFARTVTLSGCAAWREHSRECSLRWMRSCPRPIHTHSLRTTSRSADRDRCFLTKPAVWRSQVPRISL